MFNEAKRIPIIYRNNFYVFMLRNVSTNEIR